MIAHGGTLLVTKCSVQSLEFTQLNLELWLSAKVDSAFDLEQPLGFRSLSALNTKHPKWAQYSTFTWSDHRNGRQAGRRQIAFEAQTQKYPQELEIQQKKDRPSPGGMLAGLIFSWLTCIVTIRGSGCRVLAPPSMAMPRVLALFGTLTRVEVGSNSPG